MFAGQLGNHVGRNRRRVGKGLIKMPDELIDDVANLWRNKKLVMVGTKLFGGEARILELVVAILVKTYRESFYGLAHVSGHPTNYGARVDFSGKKGAQRNIGNQAQPHRFIKQCSELLEIVFLSSDFRVSELEIPVLSDLDLSFAKAEIVTGR